MEDHQRVTSANNQSLQTNDSQPQPPSSNLQIELAADLDDRQGSPGKKGKKQKKHKKKGRPKKVKPADVDEYLEQEPLLQRPQPTARQRSLETIVELEDGGEDQEPNVIGNEESKQSSMIGSQSSRSILSQEFLINQRLAPIKASIYKVKEVEVAVWSPLTIGTNFDEAITQMKKKYNRGQMGINNEYPESVKYIAGGLIIDMPEENLEPYLRKHLDIDKFLTDEELISHMETFIEHHHLQKRRKKATLNGQNLDEFLRAETIIELPGFINADETSKEAMRLRFQEILDRPTSKYVKKATHLDELQFQVKHGSKDNSMLVQLPTNKRSQAKKLEKEYQVSTMYFGQNMKPAKIAKKLRMGVDRVYQIVQNVKNNALKILNHQQDSSQDLSSADHLLSSLTSVAENVTLRKRDAKQSGKKSKASQPDLLSQIELFFETNGIYQFTSEELRKHLLTKLPEDEVPSLKIIREIMQKRFNLKFSRLDKANTQYRNPKYNEKRMWVSRLMAQLIFEDNIIICVDESNFRHDAMPSRQWQFDIQSLEPKQDLSNLSRKIVNPPKNLNLLLRTDNEIAYAQYLKDTSRGTGTLEFKTTFNDHIMSDHFPLHQNESAVHQSPGQTQQIQQVATQEDALGAMTLGLRQHPTSNEVQQNVSPYFGVASPQKDNQIEISKFDIGESQRHKSSTKLDRVLATTIKGSQLGMMKPTYTPMISGRGVDNNQLKRTDNKGLKSATRSYLGSDLSLIKRFDNLEVISAAGLLSSSLPIGDVIKDRMKSIGLTPLGIELEKLKVESGKKLAKDDSNVSIRKVGQLNEIDQVVDNKADEGVKKLNLIFEDDQVIQGQQLADPALGLSLVDKTHLRLQEQLGPFAYKAWQLSTRPSQVKKQQYSLSFLAAISQDQLMCSELIQGAYDSNLFGDAMFRMMTHLRKDEKTADRNIILFMDNARTHHHSQVLEMCRKMKVNVVFNAEYSPWLNPVEIFFGFVKKQVLKRQVNNIEELVSAVRAVLKGMNPDDYKDMWCWCMRKYIQTLTYGQA